MKSNKSKGLGDTIEKITSVTGVKRLVEKASKATGKECGCKKRQENLNNPNLLVNKVFYKHNKK
jgi:hypothetical protein